MTNTPRHQNLRTPWRIGIDVGGTFTDLVLIDSNGTIFPFKSPSEPGNPAVGVIRAVEGAASMLNLDITELLGGCAHFIHGTTVATNVLLERKGAKVGLITTSGFRDTLEIRRGYRELMWDHRTPWQEVLVRRKLRQPIVERMAADGSVVTPLDKDTVIAAVEVFKREGVEAVAICLLHAYANGAHEQQCADIISVALPDVYITASSRLAPIVGEFERASTTVTNAYVAPKVLPYLRELRAQLEERGLTRDMLLVQSNGGAISLDHIGERPAALALSGPAAGLASLQLYGKLLSAEHLISIEIGGTSCDVTVVCDGQVAETESIKVGDTLIALPSVEIHTIGTGGGTICGVDTGGLLFAGPQGAGARPGPACYGLGGTRPTVTDAQLVLGRLHPGGYANNTLQLDHALAYQAVHRDVAEPLQLSGAEAANAMLRLVEQNIRHAVEKVSLERGLDPAKFILVGAGGAGALHVAEIARWLGMREAFVPRLAGVFCALGMCHSDVRHDLLVPRGVLLNADAFAGLGTGFADLEREGGAKLKAEGFSASSIRFERKLDLRYAGQKWSISVVVPDVNNLANLRKRFHDQHAQLYGSAQPDAAIEIVNLRVAAIGKLQSLPLDVTVAPARIPAPTTTRRDVWAGDGSGKMIEMAVFNGSELQPGHFFRGPAIIDEITTTILIGDGDEVDVDQYGNYRILIGNALVRATNV
ncbi:hydantoinase/oxoprolinase family protein [Mesorhizobium sp.]|uniref:hydantoinase/oxoprolinase family protein n=1 Tax=Mesorhizobium sp. TaxID=1871066 RepID=UPI000FE4CA6B|nr:hydantoinase/oxoprolinase family protein [Mesorhizobium sp.]RWP30338.1 MAG: hydantoinase/oxoprolinase family protein [Mesorhizobium sp.]